MNYLAVSLDYALWWYSGGLRRLINWLSALFGWVSNFFSVKKIFLTLFSPWKRLVGVRRPGLDGFGDWILDNLISRSVGFVTRLVVLLCYLVAVIGLLVFGLVTVSFWIFFPFLLIISLYKAVV